MAKSTGPKKKRAAKKRKTAGVGGREHSAIARSTATGARHPGGFLPAKAGLVLRRWYRPGSTGQPKMSEALSGDLRLAKKVSEGFPTKAVDDVIEAGLVEARVLYDIVLPRRTLADRKQKDKPLSPDQSDRLARVLRVYSRAEDAIGDVTRP